MPEQTKFAIDQHRDAVGQPEDGGHVVFDEQDGDMAGEVFSISSTMRADSSGPVPAIGSSSSSSCGLVASAMASSSARCSPCEDYRQDNWLSGELQPTCSRWPAASSKSAVSLRTGRQKRKLLPASGAPCTASATLSSADRPGKTLVIW